MEFPGTIVSVDEAFASAKARGALIRQRAQALIDSSLAGPIPVKDVGDFATMIADGNDVFVVAVAMGADINAYAKSQARDATLDFVAKTQALQTAIQNVRTWLSANYPKASAGTLPSTSLQEHTFDANFRRVSVTVTSAQTAGLRTQLATITAAVT